MGDKNVLDVVQDTKSKKPAVKSFMIHPLKLGKDIGELSSTLDDHLFME